MLNIEGESFCGESQTITDTLQCNCKARTRAVFSIQLVVVNSQFRSKLKLDLNRQKKSVSFVFKELYLGIGQGIIFQLITSKFFEIISEHESDDFFLKYFTY